VHAPNCKATPRTATPDVGALAFHVTYWDRLGWKDLLANPAYTQRQVQQQRSNGARFTRRAGHLASGAVRRVGHGLDSALIWKPMRGKCTCTLPARSSLRSSTTSSWLSPTSVPATGSAP